MSTHELMGQHVVVAGGTGFLGSAVVEYFLAGGAVCHVTWHMEEELERFAYADRVQLHRVNCTIEHEVRTLYQSLAWVDASIHVIGGFAMTSVADTSADLFSRMFQLNTLTCFLCCREAIKKIREHGRGGRIVNVAARPAVQPTGGMVAYSTSKAAVASLTQCLAEEVKQDGVLINAVLPSIMDTAANRAAMPDADFSMWPKVSEVAAAIGYLGSPANRLTSGALVPVFGRA